MGLSTEKKKALKELYETWGIDKVRRDLERHQYPSLVSTDVSAFERAWIKDKEAKGRRRTQLVIVFRVFAFSMLAGTIVAILSY